MWKDKEFLRCLNSIKRELNCTIYLTSIFVAKNSSLLCLLEVGERGALKHPWNCHFSLVIEQNGNQAARIFTDANCLTTYPGRNVSHCIFASQFKASNAQNCQQRNWNGGVLQYFGWTLGFWYWFINLDRKCAHHQYNKGGKSKSCATWSSFYDCLLICR